MEVTGDLEGAGGGGMEARFQQAQEWVERQPPCAKGRLSGALCMEAAGPHVLGLWASSTVYILQCLVQPWSAVLPGPLPPERGCLLLSSQPDPSHLMLHVRLLTAPPAAAHQAPLSMAFTRQEYWSGQPFPPPGDPPDPGIEPASPVAPALQVDFFNLLSHQGSPATYSSPFTHQSPHSPAQRPWEERGRAGWMHPPVATLVLRCIWPPWKYLSAPWMGRPWVEVPLSISSGRCQP